MGTALLLWAGPVPAATVISVGDGDTLRVQDEGRKVTIRLACIDAPETAQRPQGMAAREALKRLMPVGTQVSIRPQKVDRFGRTVAEIFRGRQNMNLELVRSGHAFVYEQYIAQCHAKAYRQAQEVAKGQGSGVWSEPGGITRPWDWRRGSRPAGSARPRGTGTPSGVLIPGGGARISCGEVSWQQAQQLLRQGHTYLDRDGDGEACESSR